MSEKKTLAKEWIDRAISDLKYAYAGEKETGQHHITCYLCQQAVEKVLKGLIVLNGEQPKKTHHLGLLISEVAKDYPTFLDLRKDIRKLDKYYISARYPDDTTMEFTSDDAKGALETAQKIIDLAKIEIV